VLTVSDEQRHYLKLDGAPLPLVDYEGGQCYMLMPVTFTQAADGGMQARLPGIDAVGEADQPTEALAALAVLLQKVMHTL
jgi:hypothetical protein